MSGETKKKQISEKHSPVYFFQIYPHAHWRRALFGGYTLTS